jgi:CheY-like chemotaxis protein
VQRLGFGVLTAEGGQQPVELYRRHQSAVAAVLPDVQMPGLDGPHTLLALQRLNPAVRVVFVSGHAGNYTPELLRGMGSVAYLPKPINVVDLDSGLRLTMFPVAAP